MIVITVIVKEILMMMFLIVLMMITILIAKIGNCYVVIFISKTMQEYYIYGNDNNSKAGEKKEIAGIVITEITRREQNTVAHRDAVTT